MTTKRKKTSRIAAGMLAALVGIFLAFADNANAVMDGEQRCRVGKFKGFVKEFRDKAQCYEKSLKRSVLVDQRCLNLAVQRRRDFFDRLHGSGVCSANVSDEHYGHQIDSFFQGLAAEVSSEADQAADATSQKLSAEEGRATPVPAANPTPGVESEAAAASGS